MRYLKKKCPECNGRGRNIHISPLGTVHDTECEECGGLKEVIDLESTIKHLDQAKIKARDNYRKRLRSLERKLSIAEDFLQRISRGHNAMCACGWSGDESELRKFRDIELGEIEYLCPRCRKDTLGPDSEADIAKYYFKKHGKKYRNEDPAI
jgi:hypothetical protein